MNKEKILKKSRIAGEDEGKDFFNQKADRYGLYALFFTIIALAFYKAIKGLPVGDVIALNFVFISVGMFSRYKLEKTKSSLLFGILSTLITIGLVVSFVVITW